MKKETLKKLIESGKLAEMVSEASTGEMLTNSTALWNYIKPFFVAAGDDTVERFACVFLDAKNRVISIETLSKGTITYATVYPREIIKRALAVGAVAVIFAHNHPSGDPDPSAADKAITKQLFFACRSVGITMHEHIIVGGDRFFSFADCGLVASYDHEYINFIDG